jgi:hypothetical protein
MNFNNKERIKILNFKKAKPNDRLLCKICNKTYTRSSITAHRRTKEHQIYQRMHDRFGNVLFNEPLTI